jgi:hypothetical protein
MKVIFQDKEFMGERGHHPHYISLFLYGEYVGLLDEAKMSFTIRGLWFEISESDYKIIEP